MNEIIMGVYKIVSKTNGKTYIGSSININVRKRNHFNNLRSRRHTNSKLQNHYNKYGVDDLIFEIIETTNDPNEVLKIEQKYIDKLDTFKTGFNMSPNAGNSLGRKHSEETKMKISKIQSDKTLSEDHRKKISRSSMGRVQTEETRKKLSEATKGKPKSESARKNMSISAKNRPPISEETRQKLSKISKERIRTDEWKSKIAQSNSRSILQYDLEHNLVQEFIGAKTASDITGIGRTSIVNALSGKSKTAGGFIWEYAKS